MDLAMWQPVLRIALIVGVFMPLLEAGLHHSRMALVIYSFWRMLRLKSLALQTLAAWPWAGPTRGHDPDMGLRLRVDSLL